MPIKKPRLIVGISGASGSLYGKILLEMLHDLPIETHLVVSEAARRVMQMEVDFDFDDLARLASVVHDVHDVGASISSGSFKTMGMIIAP